MFRHGRKLTLVLFAALLGQGCQGVYTRSKLAAVRDDRVPGEWQAEGETDTFTVRLDGDGYVADFPSDKNEKPVRFLLVREGEQLYTQTGGQPCEDFPGETECYALARLELSKDTAEAFAFDTAALFDASLKETFGVSYELRRTVSVAPLPAPPNPRARNNFLLTGDEPEIRAFLARHGERFTREKPLRYRRKGALPKVP